MEKSKSEDIDFKPLEITSPRTAAAPGPVPDGCCSGGACAAGQNPAEAEEEAKASYWPTVLSLALLLAGIALDAFAADWFGGIPRLLMFLTAYALVGWRVVWHAAKSFRSSFFNEFLLMTVATLGAFYLGEFAEGVAVMLFYVVGEHFQEAAVLRSRKSIRSLIDMRPDTVQVATSAGIKSVRAAQVQLGETMHLKPGERVALDGKLLTASASFNTAALTGESVPVNIRQGEQVLAGMISVDRAVEISVTASYENSALSKILQLVEEAASRKAQTQQFISKFAKVYTPIVFLLALAITLVPLLLVQNYVFESWFYRALVFLVISCPCALVVSIPLGYFGGIGAASRNGILFKGANFLDQMTKVDTVVLDKTGTLTEGVFEVQEVCPVNMDATELAALAAALEQHSSHPIAKAVLRHGHPLALRHTAEQVQELAGHGLVGSVNGEQVLVGNNRLLKKFGVSYDAAIDEVPETTVLVALSGNFAGYLTIADKVKADAPAAMAALRKLGVQHLVVLSGDKPAIVRKVAGSLGLQQAYGGLLPQEKVQKVEELKAQGRMVAFVGDGLNDAPVIALADVGVAMGGLGSDAAIETADVVIQTDQPSKIATAINISKSTRRVVWQNISMAFLVKLLVLLLGAGGVATMWEAVFADVGVALLAILNAVRVQRMRF